MTDGNVLMHRGVKIIAALCLLAYLSGGAWFYRSHEKGLRGEAEKQLGTIARLKGDQIVRWRDERLNEAKEIAERPLLDEMVFARAPDPDETTVARGDEIIAAGLFELMDAFAKLLSRSSEENVVTLTAETVSVRERMVELMDLLALHQTLSFDELFTGLPTRTDLVVTFLAILEMAKISAVRIVQHVQTGGIRIFAA